MIHLPTLRVAMLAFALLLYVTLLLSTAVASAQSACMDGAPVVDTPRSAAVAIVSGSPPREDPVMRVYRALRPMLMFEEGLDIGLTRRGVEAGIKLSM